VPDAHPFHCRLCGHVAEPQPWGGAECPACGSVSVTEIPTPEILAAYYAAYVDTYSGGGDSGGASMRRYAERYSALVRRFVPSGRPLKLLDVGTSNNPFPNVMAALGHHVTVLDYVRPHGLAGGVEFVAGHLGDAASFETLAGGFDVVTSWAVMEHVPDPHRSATQLASAVRPGGHLIVSSPEHGTALTRHSLGRSGWFFPPEHLHLISPRAMDSLFGAQGLEPLSWGRLELSLPRWIARYGIGAAEALAGAAVKALAPPRWHKARRTQRHRYKGVDLFAYRRSVTRCGPAHVALETTHNLIP
jgi:SAM-dependent methyltransferase